MIIKNKIKEIFVRKETIKYLIIGSTAFVADYGIFLISYYLIELSLSTATTMGFFTGFFISFVANRYWVFGGTGSTRPPIRQLLEYAILVVFNYLFTLISLNWLNNAEVKPAVGKVLIMGLIVVWNYLIFQKFIFSDDKESRK